MIIFLIGFMGSGKSTTGKKLATKLDYSFLDTDTEIIEKFDMSINKIFKKYGEAVFRKEERQQLENLINKDNFVVATGGGLPCQADNMELMNRIGTTVYLKASPKALLKRLYSRAHKRPLIKDLSKEELETFIKTRLSERKPYYKQAKITVAGIDTDLKNLKKQLGF